MIEVGDLVRFRNTHLRPPYGILCRVRWFGRGKNSRFRGKQQIARVVSIHVSPSNTIRKYPHRLLTLDIPNDWGPHTSIDESYCTVHRKHRRREREALPQ